MALRYLTGDLLASAQYAIGHGCNARGSMGAGVAAAIKRTYPGAFAVYADAYRNGGLTVGKVVPWYGNDRAVFNCITQERYGNDPNITYVDYAGVASCMRWIEQAAQEQQATRRGIFATQAEIAFPRIGAGLARGDWDRIAGIIEAEIKSLEVVIYAL